MSGSTEESSDARIRRARTRIASGYYDHPEVIAATLDRTLKDLRECPLGEGDRYRDLATEFIALNLGRAVDHEHIEPELRLPSGRADAGLPLCLEELDRRALWNAWRHDYGIDSIIVEAKNWESAVGPPAVDQTLRYLAIAKRGRLGMLVSRHGFSPGARDALSALAASSDFLILPFTEGQLQQWSLTCDTPTAKDRFLRRIKNQLVAAA